jgi:hypothetical protein
MSCYFRQMKDLFDEADITVTHGNKKRIYQTFYKYVGVDY